MRVTLTLSADTAGTVLAAGRAPRRKLTWDYAIQSGGTFGGGTLSFLVSLDGGTTKNALKDVLGTAYSTTTADTFTGTLPASIQKLTDPEPIIYAVLSGATNPALTLVLQDNR